jgi:predicted metal-dependent phosphoesterase TrpH
LNPITLTGTAFVDLQIHTIYSDGHWQPEELFHYLAEKKFALVSITDHDRVDRVEEVQAVGQQAGVAVLAGVEITTEWRGKMGHMLAYGIDPHHPALNAVLKKTVNRQLENTRMVYQELRSRGREFPRQVEVLAEQGGNLVRPVDNARLLQAHGYASSFQEAISQITDAGFRSMMADMAEAVAAVHEAGGVALIAHPGRRETGFTLYDTALLDAVSAEIPLDGIEVVHPSHSAEQIAEYERYVERRGWLKSTGSDSHGPRHRYPITHQAKLSSHLLQRCGITVQEG